MNAVITGVEDFGLFVQGVELPADGLVHISSLQDDYYRYDATSHSLVGHREGHRYRLGDLVNVEVMRVDVDRRELDFRMVPASGEAVPLAPRAERLATSRRPRGALPAAEATSAASANARTRPNRAGPWKRQADWLQCPGSHPGRSRGVAPQPLRRTVRQPSGCGL